MHVEVPPLPLHATWDLETMQITVKQRTCVTNMPTSLVFLLLLLGVFSGTLAKIRPKQIYFTNWYFTLHVIVDSIYYMTRLKKLHTTILSLSQHNTGYSLIPEIHSFLHSWTQRQNTWHTQDIHRTYTWHTHDIHRTYTVHRSAQKTHNTDTPFPLKKITYICNTDITKPHYVTNTFLETHWPISNVWHTDKALRVI